MLGVVKRLDEVSDICRDGIGDWGRLVEILCELVIDVVSARNALFSKGSLAIGGELITFRRSRVRILLLALASIDSITEVGAFSGTPLTHSWNFLSSNHVGVRRFEHFDKTFCTQVANSDIECYLIPSLRFPNNEIYVLSSAYVYILF